MYKCSVDVENYNINDNTTLHVHVRNFFNRFHEGCSSGNEDRSPEIRSSKISRR